MSLATQVLRPKASNKNRKVEHWETVWCTWWLQTLDSLGTKLSRASCTSGSVGISSSSFLTRRVILEITKKKHMKKRTFSCLMSCHNHYVILSLTSWTKELINTGNQCSNCEISLSTQELGSMNINSVSYSIKIVTVGFMGKSLVPCTFNKVYGSLPMYF